MIHSVPAIRSIRTLLLLVGAVMLTFATPAQAYIDPGAGGLLVQLITGGVAGALILVRMYWRRLVDRVKGKSKTAAPEPPIPTVPADRRDGA
jgi:hypothetical protein